MQRASPASLTPRELLKANEVDTDNDLDAFE